MKSISFHYKTNKRCLRNVRDRARVFPFFHSLVTSTIHTHQLVSMLLAVYVQGTEGQGKGKILQEKNQLVTVSKIYYHYQVNLDLD